MTEKNMLPQNHDDGNYISKTQGEMLLEMIAISGEYPAENITRLIDAPSYAKKVVSKLLGKGQIKTVYKNSVRGYRLTIKGKRQLMAENPDRFEGILEGVGDTNKFRSDLPRRLRLHSLAQVYTLMLNTEAEIFQDNKQMIFGDSSQSLREISEYDPHCLSTPCFYSSREQKGDDEKSNAIQGSRAAGTIMTNDHAYAVYNTGNTHISWGEKVEERYKTEINSNLERLYRHKLYAGNPLKGILIGERMESLERYWLEKKKKGSGLSFLANAFPDFYYVTNDVHGEKQLKLLYDSDEKARVEKWVTEKFEPTNTNCPVIHDALTENGNPVLFCYLLNIPRLLRYFNGLARYDKNGTVITLNSQTDVLRRYLGNRVDYKTLNF